MYDGRGKLVGSVIDVSGTQPSVAVKVGDDLATFAVDAGGFQALGNTAGSTLIFASADCTGQAFDGFGPGAIGPDSGGLFCAFFVLNGTTLYTVVGEEQTFTANSALNQEGAFCEQVDFPHTARPLKALVDLAAVFQPPFSIRGK